MDLLKLDGAIERSGLKHKAIAEKLGITAQGFRKKRKGVTEFKVSEVNVLTELLTLTDEEKEDIFFGPSVDKKETS